MSKYWGANMSNLLKSGLFAAALLGLAPAANAAVVLSNSPTGNNISSFGNPDSQTYGQVFTAPITGVLTSFTLSLNGGVGALYGAVGTWNGTAAHGLGFGSPVTLFKSGDTPSSSAVAVTFSPNIAVTAGELYVAYLSTFGVAGASGTTSMPLGTGEPGVNYFVWNNSSDGTGTGPDGNPSWNYFNNFGNAQFSATFDVASAAPEPGTWLMMIVGFGLVGAGMRRKRAKTKVNFAFG